MTPASWITIVVVILMIYGLVRLASRKEMTEEEFEREARRPSLLRTGLQELQGFLEPSTKVAQEAVVKEKKKTQTPRSGEGRDPVRGDRG